MRPWTIPSWIALLAAATPGQDRAAEDLLHAPPPREVDGLLAVPLDLARLEAELVFDYAARTARAVAEIDFTTGAVAGHPVFDLRQPVEQAWLDGVALEPAELAAHDFGPATGTMRILARELAPGTRHRLKLAYPVGLPDAPGAQDLGWGDDGLFWDLWMSDLAAGRYLEMWFPANLIYDRFEFQLDLELRGAPGPHELVTNGDVEPRGANAWRLRFPASFASFSPMIVLVPAARVERARSRVSVRGGRRIEIEVVRLRETRGSLEQLVAETEAHLREFSRTTGPWLHRDRCTIFVQRGGRSMEYDGATTTSAGALRHELFHSWWGRGVKPASQDDGWIDEAWDTWAADGGRTRGGPAPPDGPPVALHTGDPWNRITAGASYGAGSAFFARLAARIGADKLSSAMADFYRKNAQRSVTTAALEDHLVRAAHDDELRKLFARYVHGREEAAD